MSDFVHRLEVRFRDCDALGHVNNAVYFTYLEQTRFAHWRALWGFGPGERPGSQLPEGMPGVILAHAECDFRRPARYGQQLEIRLRVPHVGRTSFRYEYQIVDEEGRPVADAKTIQVMYDYQAGRSVTIPDEIRRLLSGAPTGRQT
jgi:acyl-CoA thioester hydrolase